MAEVVVIAKSNAAETATVDGMAVAVAHINPAAKVLRGRSDAAADDPDALRGRRVLVVEDGPTITHGGMPHGAGYAVCRELDGTEIVDPRPAAVGDIAAAYAAYPHIGPVLPALGYSDTQLDDLRRTIDAVDAEIVAVATPIDLAARLDIGKPAARVRYAYAEADDPGLGALVDAFIAERLL
jgi:predicted GTPase